MKKYGLQLRVPPSQQKKPPRVPVSTPLGFQGDDEEDVEREIARHATKNKALRDTEELHKKALEEDPTVFDYDGVYEEMKEKIVRPLSQDRTERKSKYIQALLEKAKERERQHEVVYERKIAKERSKDDHLFADKDKFVTGAYKRKLAEQAKWLEEERLCQLREEKDDVTKKNDMSDFYFNLSKNVAFGAHGDELRKPKDVDKVNPKEEVATGISGNDCSLTNSTFEPSSAKERHQGETSTVPEKTIESLDAKMVSESSLQEKTTAEQPVPDEQKRDDHHKRSVDAVTSAKERYLARKMAKKQ